VGPVRHAAPRGPGALEPGTGAELGFWAITRYEDIWAVDRDSETFTSQRFVNLEEVDDDLMDVRRSMLETDGPRHLACAAHRAASSARAT
jgi:cytochrome P450